MQQLVREPTRGQYLLDLYLTDVVGTKVEVGPTIADHKFILARVPLPEVKTLQVKKERFDLKRADWPGLKKSLSNIDWKALRKGTAEEAAKFFMEMLWMNSCTFIPYVEVQAKKKAHPWLNERCEAAIQRKNSAEGTDRFPDYQKECAAVMTEEYQKHLGSLKEKIASLSKGSKEWWRLNRELLEKKTKCSSIPSLQDD